MHSAWKLNKHRQLETPPSVCCDRTTVVRSVVRRNRRNMSAANHDAVPLFDIQKSVNRGRNNLIAIGRVTGTRRLGWDILVRFAHGSDRPNSATDSILGGQHGPVAYIN